MSELSRKNRVTKLVRTSFYLVFYGALILASFLVPADIVKTVAPWALLVIGLGAYASFQVRFENIEMDMDAIEESLDRLEPNYHHQLSRFRYGRKDRSKENPRAGIEPNEAD